MKSLALIVVMAGIVGCAGRTPEMQIVEDAAHVMGGKDRILAVDTLLMEGQATGISSWKRSIDFVNWRSRLEQGRTPESQDPAPETEPLSHHPLGLIRAALHPGARLSNARTRDSQDLVDVTTSRGETVTLALDNTTKLPLWISSVSYNQGLGDMKMETRFSEYEEVDGLKLPAHLVTVLDRRVIADIQVTDQTVNADVGNLAAPPGVASSAR